MKQVKQVLLVISDSGNPRMGRYSYNWWMDCPFLNDIDIETKETFAKKQVEIYKEFAEGKISYYFHEK
jgi:hypothetical protein